MHVTPAQLAYAVALRDEHSANQYPKIWLMSDQLGVLIWMCIAGFAVFPIDIWAGGPSAAKPWEVATVIALLFFGLVGAALSAAQSLIASSTASSIPERVANHFVTMIRAGFGAVAGLVGYAFLKSNLFPLKTEQADITSTALSVAFVFGYGGERLISRVVNKITGGSQSKGQSKNG